MYVEIAAEEHFCKLKRCNCKEMKKVIVPDKYVSKSFICASNLNAIFLKKKNCSLPRVVLQLASLCQSSYQFPGGKYLEGNFLAH
jgi:hypothetical protein